MIIECPKCKSTFTLNKDKEAEAFSKFKCSVCNHIWKNEKHAVDKNTTKSQADMSIRYLLFLNLAIVFFTIIVIIVYKSKLEYVDENWSYLYNFFINLIPIK
tara:strand:+ start:439 stop:744 length:306 start_codon:yes stop_codon:yes gene_type:complete